MTLKRVWLKPGNFDQVTRDGHQIPLATEDYTKEAYADSDVGRAARFFFVSNGMDMPERPKPIDRASVRYGDK